jgi:cysteinyl-tRNA synthetase
VIHITDLDDKTIDGADREGLDLDRFTDRQIEGIKGDLALLGIDPADESPKTSDHVPDMIRMGESLVKTGAAYEKLRSLYFDLTRVPDYGTLSGIDVDKIRVGATVDLDEYEKDNPRDFTLFKRSTLSELRKGIFFKTDWGNVRPSWHIQSAAIARKYHGDQFDIHTSSLELAFPHHENEIAIATALAGKAPAKYWFLSERVLSGVGRQEDKAEEFTLKTLTDMGFSGREIRYWLISGHYRKPLTFSPDRLEHARSSLKRLDACIQSLLTISKGESFPEISQLVYDLKQGFTTAMDEDLNISAALASIFKVVKRINLLITENRLDSSNARSLLDAFRKIDEVLRIFDFGQNAEDEKVKALLEKRREARQGGDWTLADRLRDELEAMGVHVRDEKL